MEWFKTAANIGDDPALQAAGERAAWLWHLARGYIASAETGGLIPVTQIPRFGLSGVKVRVAALLKAGLWVAEDGGYRDVRWVDDQSELEALAARRRSDRDRQRRHRAATAPKPPGGPVDNRPRRDPTGEYFGPPHETTREYDENYPRVDDLNDDTKTPSLFETIAGDSTEDPPMSRDTSRRQSRDVTSPEESREEEPPDPPPGGERDAARASRCARHRARPKSWCSDCRLPPIVRPDAPRVAEVLGAAGCDHGASDPRLCAFCRTGTAPPDLDAAAGAASPA